MLKQRLAFHAVEHDAGTALNLHYVMDSRDRQPSGVGGRGMPGFAAGVIDAGAGVVKLDYEVAERINLRAASLSQRGT